MRQFSGSQSTDIHPIPKSFKRIDGRGRAETDWFLYHLDSIANWNDRAQFIVPITPPVGDGREEWRIYKEWYQSKASLYLLRPSNQPPTTYYPKSPSERYLVDYFVRTKGIVGPFIGGTGENASSMQLALDEIGELSARVDQSVYIDYDAAHVSRAENEDLEIVFEKRRKSRSSSGQSSRRRSTSDVPRASGHTSTPAQTEVMMTGTEAGPSTQFHPSYDLGYMTPGAGPSQTIAEDYSNPYEQMPQWMMPVMYNPVGYEWAPEHMEQPPIWQPQEGPTGTSYSEQEEQMGGAEHDLRGRPTQAPTRYTPGSRALGRKKK